MIAFLKVRLLDRPETPMMLGRSLLAAVTAALTVVATPAWALRPTPQATTNMQVASGSPLRLARNVEYQVPADHAAWRSFSQRFENARWSASWDVDTGAPSRIWGRGIAAPGSIHSPQAAEAFARDIMSSSLDLLAPGARAGDFELAANKLSNGMRVVSFVQRHQGLRVIGGQLSFRFKKDRLFVIGSEAMPNVSVGADKTRVSDAIARREAASWVQNELGGTVRPSEVSGPYVLPLISNADVSYRRVLEVRVDQERPIGRWSVFVDAATAAPIARKQRLMFASGTLSFNTPDRRPTDARSDKPAPNARISMGASIIETAPDGTFTFTDSPANATAGVVGPLVTVINAAGQRATQAFTIEDGATFVWNAADTEFIDSQLTTFVASHKAKDKVREIEPNMPFIGDQLEATVNMDDNCNAFSDGTTINFFRAGSGCDNTGRLPDVVYHEFGHSVHAHAIIDGAGDFDSALSEGISDYLAATITGDPGTARGFFGDDRPLRHIDPRNGEYHWPEDISGDPHETGLIIAGALWDMRKALIIKHGEPTGALLTDRAWFEILQRASDISTTYVEVLATDDDDGDLTNGTPNLCEINAAFEIHGLAARDQVGPRIGKVSIDNLKVTVPVTGSSLCPGAEISSAELTWQVRDVAGSGGVIPMTSVNGAFEAQIPAQAEGSVVQYRVELTPANGEAVSLPDNPADPTYEVFVGNTVPIYCTDFENDPLMEGWSHRLVRGTQREGADDWQWGEPNGVEGSGDPDTANSGTRVMGNDLGGGNYNGLYQSDKTNELVSPVIDVNGKRLVRLQYYRWLNVEDGFFDHATILADGMQVWQNTATDERGSTHHTDKEWRFHDVDLSGAAADGSVQISFRIESDRGLELGGWTVDDFCIVEFQPSNARCGDNMLSPGEQCDDGNMTNGDGCESNCTMTPPAICGDGMLQNGELCDDGNDVDTDACKSDCTPTIPAMCGDGLQQLGEQCDDGNLQSGDGCEANCTVLMGGGCGNGIVDPGESCDLGAQNGIGACSLDCQPRNPGLGESPAGCGCSTTSNEHSSAWLLLAFAALAFGLRQRQP